MVRVVERGLVPYGEALAEMRALRAARRRGEIEDTLLLLEHPPVVTVGVQGDDGEPSPEGIPVFRVERGGKGTYHGPGQLVGYPIVDLARRGRDVRRFVGELEETLLRALGEVGVSAGRVEGRRGVWVAGERKIASIGIAVDEWVSFHGFALNVDNDLAPFRAFRPCGFDGRIMTSVALERGRPASVGELVGPVRRSFVELFEDDPARRAPAPAPAAVPA